MKEMTSVEAKTRKQNERNARNGREQVLDGEVWNNALRLVDDGGDAVRMSGLHFFKEKAGGEARTLRATAARSERAEGIGETSGRTRTFV